MGGAAFAQSESAMSSLMDAWILLQDFEGNGERNRELYVLKARGMKHSNLISQFLISDRGIDVVGRLHRPERRAHPVPRARGAKFLGEGRSAGWPAGSSPTQARGGAETHGHRAA